MGKPWTIEEDNLIREKYPQLGIWGLLKEFADKGFDRTYLAIKNRAHQLKVKGAKKSEEK